MAAAEHPTLDFKITIRLVGKEKEYDEFKRWLDFGLSPFVRETDTVDFLTERVKDFAKRNGIYEDKLQYIFSRVAATNGESEIVFAVHVDGQEAHYANENGDLFSRNDVNGAHHALITSSDEIFKAPRGCVSKVVAWICCTNSEEEINITNIQESHPLGSGDIGVYIENGDSQRKTVRKILPYNVQNRKLVVAEILMLRFLKHQNIVRCFTHEIRENQAFIYMEYVSGTSLDRMRNIKDYEVSNFTSQLVDALAYIHDEALIHRDIRPSNILIDENRKLKLKGFQYTKFTTYKPAGSRAVNSCSTSADTIPQPKDGRINAYRPPELVLSKRHKMEGDIWNLGQVVLYMITGEKPWIDKNNMQIYHAMRRHEPPHRENDSRITSEWMTFFNDVFNYTFSERPTARSMRNLPFYKREREREAYNYNSTECHF